MSAPTDGRGAERKAHVIFVLPSLLMGGAEGHLASVFEAEPEALERHRVTLLTFLPQRHEPLAERLRRAGVRLRTIDRTATSFPAFMRSLVRFFREERPDLVHAILAGSTGTWGRLAGRLAGVPHVALSDRSLDPTLSRSQRALDRMVNRMTTRFLPNAQAIADRLERQGVPRERIRLVRNGVELSRFAPDSDRSLRDAWGVPPDATVAGFLGMLRPKKRPDLLLDAVLALPVEQRPDHVVVGGDGEMMPGLRERIEADPWARERVRLLGLVDDTPAFLRSIDFLVLTSDTEGLPNAILEAMATGRPSVATRVSDVPYLVGDDRFLGDPGDVPGMAAAIARMTTLDPAERERLGREALARAREEFSMEAAARRFWAAQEDLLREPRR